MWEKVVQVVIVCGLIVGSCVTLELADAGCTVVPEDPCVRDPQTIIISRMENGNDSVYSVRDSMKLGGGRLMTLEQRNDGQWDARFKRYFWRGSAVIRQCRLPDLPEEEQVPAAVTEAVQTARRSTDR
jgi:hypothetical protein